MATKSAKICNPWLKLLKILPYRWIVHRLQNYRFQLFMFFARTAPKVVISLSSDSTSTVFREI